MAGARAKATFGGPAATFGGLDCLMQFKTLSMFSDIIPPPSGGAAAQPHCPSRSTGGRRASSVRRHCNGVGRFRAPRSTLGAWRRWMLLGYVWCSDTARSFSAVLPRSARSAPLDGCVGHFACNARAVRTTSADLSSEA